MVLPITSYSHARRPGRGRPQFAAEKTELVDQFSSAMRELFRSLRTMRLAPLTLASATLAAYERIQYIGFPVQTGYNGYLREDGLFYSI